MTRTRLGLLGLCAMVFGLMAFGATGAHAEVGAKWLILNSKSELKEGSTLHAEVGLEKDSLVYVLHTEILKIKVLYLCTNLEAINAKLQEQGIIGKEVITNPETGLKEGRGSQIKFTGCITELGGSVAPECEPKDVVGGAGTVITKPGHALIKLHILKNEKGEEIGRDDIVELLPDTGLGTTFAVIESTAACPIGTKVPVIGSLALKDCENLFLTHLKKHLVEPFTPLTKLFTISETAEHTATFLGSAWAFLKGEHEGLLWSGDPA